MIGGLLRVRLVDQRKCYADRDSGASLVGPGDCLDLPDAEALHFVARALSRAGMVGVPSPGAAVGPDTRHAPAAR